MTATRRTVLAGLGAAVTTRVGPHSTPLATNQGGGDNAVGAALDEARALPPTAALRRLEGLRATGLAARLDLGAARSGLAIDAALTAFPPREEQRGQLTAARDAGWPGAVRLPDGARWYGLQLRRQLGDGVDPLVAERRLQAVLADLHRRASPLFDRLGVPSGEPGERFRRVWADEAQLYPDGAAGRDEAVADMAATLAAIRPRVTALTGPLPPASLAVTVRRLSPAEAAAGKGGFRDLPAPGRAGAYVVDLRDIRRRPRWSLPAVVAHELLPGHMTQLPVEAETPPHPLRLDYAGAFVEGWAIHAEALAARIGAYPDARTRLGHLHWLIFRAARALADLGIHLHGWTLAEARARLVAWQGEPAYFAAFDTDLARIAIEPGVRAAEALMWLALADRSAGLSVPALARFNRAVLAGGRRRLEQLP